MGSTPFPRGEENEWFAAAKAGRLVYQRCADCGKTTSYTRAICPFCWSSALVTRTSRGRGTIHSFTVQYRPGGVGFDDEVPYTIALVDVDEGFRALGDIRDADPQLPTIGCAVEVFFDRVDAELTLPRFRRIGGTDS